LAYIFWRQLGVFNALEFDLSQPGNSLPTQGTGSAAISLPAGVTLSGDATNEVVVHNADMIWRAGTTDPGVSTSLFQTRFAAGGMHETIVLSSDVGATNEPSTEQIVAANVYGGDHGLTSLYAFFEEAPSSTADRSVMCAKSDLDSTTLAREVADIDAGADRVTAFMRLSPNRQPVWSGTRINRTSSWIGVFWCQEVVGTTTVDHAHANVVQTRTSGAARTLGDSVATAAALPNQDAAEGVVTDDLGGDSIDPSGGARYGDDIPRVAIQSEMGDGTSRPSDGVQSNANRINLSVRQSIAAVSTQNLIHNGLIFAAGAAATPPTFTFAVPGSAPAGLVDTRIFDEQEVVTDAGLTDGSPLIYYLAEDAAAPLSGGGSSGGNIRLFGYAAGGSPQLVSTSGPAGRFADVNRIRIQTTAIGSGGGSTLHVFFTEPPTLGGELNNIDANGRSLRTRHLSKSAFAGAPRGTGAEIDAAFRAAHTPVLGTDPVTLDNGRQQEDTQIQPPLPTTDADEMGPRVAFSTTNGSDVAIYFRTRQHDANEGGHVWYQAFLNGSWYSEPQPVDTNNYTVGIWPGEDNGLYVFPPRHETSTNTMSRTMIFFAKPQHGNDNAIGKERRWYVRVHE
jgi:hypothetical protein